MYVFVCVGARLSKNILNVSECVPLYSSSCHSVCPLFHNAVCLLSGARRQIIFSIFICLSFPFCRLYSGVFFSFCPGICAIRVNGLQSLDAICRMISELMLHFCTIPMSNFWVKTGLFLFSAVRSHKEWPDRRLREASVLYFNILICLYCLHYGTLKQEMSTFLLHY